MKKIKCQIVTFYNAINYGAVLQTYALKKAMSSFCNTTIYRYKNKTISRVHSINPFVNFGLMQTTIRLLKFFPRLIKKIKFKKFVKKYLLNDNEADSTSFYITGSDQVWNYECTNFDKTFFLDFVKDEKFKNSYAASFGISEIPLAYEKEYINLLKGFNRISVRENTGREIIKNLLNKEVSLVLDPSFLLSKEQWVADFPSDKSKGKFILVYAFVITAKMKDFMMKLSEKTKLPIIILMPEKPIRTPKIPNVTYKSFVSPEEFIDYFSQATYVVTNSFHGTAFSINFNKNFFVETLPNESNVNSRLVDILELFQLNDRLISEKSLLNLEADFSDANNILIKYRKESMEYLKSIVETYNE